LLSGLAALKENVIAQSTFDMDLRNHVAPPCQDSRLPATDAERAGLNRFVAFMDERLTRMGTSYDRTTSLIKNMEGIVKGQ